MSLPALFLFFVTMLAYFIKGFSGFGPAMVIVPSFTLIKGAPTALTTSAFLDSLAGLLLIGSVWKDINWRFVWPITISISIGSFIGSNLMVTIPVALLRRLIGTCIFVFVGYLLFSQNSNGANSTKKQPPFLGPIMGLLSGTLGGIVGMSGPPLIAYMKYYYSKDFFRTQLIVIFLVEKFVRLMVYGSHKLLPTSEWLGLAIYIPFFLVGLWIGNHFHAHVSEKQFNRLVAVILVLPAIRLLFF